VDYSPHVTGKAVDKNTADQPRKVTFNGFRWNSAPADRTKAIIYDCQNHYHNPRDQLHLALPFLPTPWGVTKCIIWKCKSYGYYL